MMEEIEEEIKEEKLSKKIITIIGLICVIGLIIYFVFIYGIVIPTVYDQFLG